MASLVVSVCLESLLKVKQTIFSEVRLHQNDDSFKYDCFSKLNTLYWWWQALKVDSFRLVRAVHYLLMVFDEIATQNRSAPLNSLLLAVLFDGQQNASFLQEVLVVLVVFSFFFLKKNLIVNEILFFCHSTQFKFWSIRRLLPKQWRAKTALIYCVNIACVLLNIFTHSLKWSRYDSRFGSPYDEIKLFFLLNV